MKFIALFCLAVTCYSSYAQDIFSEKFPGCISSVISIEKDTANTKLDKEKLVRAFKGEVGLKVFKKIRGVLSLQVFVDTIGTPCLLSAENKTNISSDRLRLKELFDHSMMWSKPSKNVFALLVLTFTDDGILFKRIGHGCNGWGDIKE